MDSKSGKGMRCMMQQMRKRKDGGTKRKNRKQPLTIGHPRSSSERFSSIRVGNAWTSTWMKSPLPAPPLLPPPTPHPPTLGPPRAAPLRATVVLKWRTGCASATIVGAPFGREPEETGVGRSGTRLVERVGGRDRDREERVVVRAVMLAGAFRNW